MKYSALKNPLEALYKFYIIDKPASEDLLKQKYQEQSLVDAASIPVSLPEIPEFAGSHDDIGKIFKSLLTNQEGLFIGEVHSHQTPKQVLKDQMHNLAEMGVKTLFLEHCCYDTLQDELDRFFETKEASPLLKHFLTHGCGGCVADNNYYDLVKAAVDAGIRPIGLEQSKTQSLGFDCRYGSGGPKRMLGLNVVAKEIIEKHKKEGKYIALVGSGHLSYHHSVAGMSELCNAPNLVITDSADCLYEKNLRNLGEKDKSQIQKEFGNNGEDHFVHVQLSLKPS